MMKRKESTFYDIYTYIEELSSIKLSNQIFYFGFALENRYTYETFVDERIYYPKAYFQKVEWNGNFWYLTKDELELKRCKLGKFSNLYREKFKNKSLDNLYCFKEMNEKLVGHSNSDYQSYFYISFFPMCKYNKK